jgi:hypothetical protein
VLRLGERQEPPAFVREFPVLVRAAHAEAMAPRASPFHIEFSSSGWNREGQ